MIPIQQTKNLDLIWRRAISYQESYELISQVNVVGKLRFEQGKKTSMAEIAEGKWIFRNSNFSAPHISIWTLKKEFVGMFEANRYGEGSLLIYDGRQLRWEKAKRNPEVWNFLNLSNEKIVHFVPEYQNYRVRGSAHIYPGSSEFANLSLYVLLGWNIISVLESRRNIRLLTDKRIPW